MGPASPSADRPEAADYHTSGRYNSYQTPYPLSNSDFLVSARGADDKFRLYLMDVHGNRELIYEGAYHVWHAIPVKPRPAPPQIPDRVAWPGTGKHRTRPAMGTLYSADVYQGVPDLRRQGGQVRPGLRGRAAGRRVYDGGAAGSALHPARGRSPGT